jgi:hypothetical protein
MNALESHTLRLIGENLGSPDVFPDTDTGLTQIRDSLNDAIEELNMATGAYSRRFRLATSEEQPFYRLSPKEDSILYIKLAWDNESKTPIVQTDFGALVKYDPFWLQSLGSPRAYCFVGYKYFLLYPAPTNKGRIIDLECACIPRRYTYDLNLVKLREQYHRAAVYYGVSEYFASRGDAARATENFTKYLETAKLMSLNPQTVDRTYQFGKRSEGEK